MTVIYSAEVATASFGCFLKLLFRWQGSIYKILWKDFIVYIVLYYILRVVYRYAMQPSQMRIFEQLCKYCDSYNTLIPLAFVLGFYVQAIVNKWQNQWNVIPFPDRTSVLVNANIIGLDERTRMIRRAIVRYLMVGYVLMMRSISPRVKRRFPTLRHLQLAGLLQPGEQIILENIKTSYNKYSIPIIWATSLVALSRKEGKITNSIAVAAINDEINNFRQGLNKLFLYDWVGIPLVYTQIVTIAVHMYFLLSLFSQQFLVETDGKSTSDSDLYVPYAGILQFLFYMGWLKVAETLINPFGDDDDDFEINKLIDRNHTMMYMYVDSLHDDHPDLVKDMYFDTQEFELPYTKAAAETQKKNMEQARELDAISNMAVSDKKSVFITKTPTDAMGMGISEDGAEKGEVMKGKKLHGSDDIPDGSGPVKRGSTKRVHIMPDPTSEKQPAPSGLLKVEERIRPPQNDIYTDEGELPGQVVQKSTSDHDDRIRKVKKVVSPTKKS